MPKKANTSLQFDGFISPRYTQVPDELFDELMAHLSGAELKVLLYIIRRTFGFKKDSDNISLNQICKGIKTRVGEVIDKGTGLSLSTVQIALKGLIEKNCVVTVRNRSKEKGDEPTTYSLNILRYTDYRQGGIPKIGNGGYRKSVTQETVLQQTDLQHRNSNSKSYNYVSNDNKGYKNFQIMGELLKEKMTHKSIGLHEIPESLKVIMNEISREFGEKRNFRSNLTHVIRIIQKSGKKPENLSAYLYEARSITKQQNSVRKKMLYFFSVLEDICGVKRL
ncbi:MAG: replication protein [Acidobacteria bacterium]|nr:replication protein [Acidobacteriota bacterium]